ncbi:Phosphoethanolamine MethylTransferase, partial [Trichostrongylus colubriformis]
AFVYRTKIIKMPAVERQLVECVRRVMKDSDESLRVGIVTPHDGHNEALMEHFGSKSTTSTCKDINSIENLSDLNVLVVNQALVKELLDSTALDKFICGALRSLRVDGVLIVRQDLAKLNDSKKVAMLTDYFDVFRLEQGNENVGFHFYAVNEVQESVYVSAPKLAGLHLDPSQEAFPQASKWTCFNPVQDFLDRTQYTDTGIFAYEWIFGDNFISPGGYKQNLAILKRFGPMKTGQTMLDIGVGIGGGARQAAREFGLHVLGVDLSTNMLAVALDRVHKEKDARVT